MLIFALLVSVLVASLALMFSRATPRCDRRPRIPPPRFRAVVIDLLCRLGMDVVEEELRGPARRLVAVRGGKPEAGRCLVFVEGAPPDDLVPLPLVDELADSVRGGNGTVGVLVTPYRIVPPGACDVRMELVDGVKLRRLVAAYLPEQLAELDGYFGFNGAAG